MDGLSRYRLSLDLETKGFTIYLFIRLLVNLFMILLCFLYGRSLDYKMNNCLNFDEPSTEVHAMT